MPRLKKKSTSMKQKEMKARRLNETNDEKVAKREEARCRMARLRAAETVEQTLTRRAVNAARLAKKRAAETAKQKIERQAVAARFARKKAAENVELKVKCRAKNVASMAEKRAAETAEQKIERQATNAARFSRKNEHPCQLEVPSSLQRKLHGLACNQDLVISLVPALQESHFTSHQRHSSAQSSPVLGFSTPDVKKVQRQHQMINSIEERMNEEIIVNEEQKTKKNDFL